MAHLGSVGLPPSPGDKHCRHKHSSKCVLPIYPHPPATQPCRRGGNITRAQPPPSLHPEPGKALSVGHRHCHPHQDSGRRVTSVGSPWGVHRDNRAASPQPACFPTPSTALGLGAGSDPCKVLPTCLKLHLCCSPHSISAYTAMTAAIATHPLALGTPEPPPAPRIWWLSTGRGLLPDFCPIPTLPPGPLPLLQLMASRSSVSKNGARAKPRAGNSRRRGAAPPSCPINTSTQ